MKRVVVNIAAASVLAGSAHPLAGQVLGAGLGPTFSLESGGGTDFHLMGTVRFDRGEGNPLGFRIDGMLQFTSGSDLFIGTANALYSFNTAETDRIRPYVIGGAGLYADGGTDFGINLGAGTTFPLGLGDSPPGHSPRPASTPSSPRGTRSRSFPSRPGSCSGSGSNRADPDEADREAPGSCRRRDARRAEAASGMI